MSAVPRCCALLCPQGRGVVFWVRRRQLAQALGLHQGRLGLQGPSRRRLIHSQQPLLVLSSLPRGGGGHPGPLTLYPLLVMMMMMAVNVAAPLPAPYPRPLFGRSGTSARGSAAAPTASRTRPSTWRCSSRRSSPPTTRLSSIPPTPSQVRHPTVLLQQKHHCLTFADADAAATGSSAR